MHLPRFLAFPAVDSAQAVVGAAAFATTPFALRVKTSFIARVVWGQALVFRVHG